MIRRLIFFLFMLQSGFLAAQKDSVLIFYGDTAFNAPDKSRIHWKTLDNRKPDLTFSGTRITQNPDEFDSTGSITLSGYVSTYYGYYSDTSNSTGYQKFPTSAPKHNTFSLNIIQLSMRYQSNNFRGILSLHYGDIPQSCWSAEYNMIQEANAGFRIAKKLWFDAGFFRTHIGLESIQPRENIAYSIATTTYFEPYFLSGAKLTWNTTPKLTLQLNAFNSFNTFHETNDNKALGVSVLYEFSKKLSLTLNSISCDETPKYTPRKQPRIYNNLYLIYKSRKFDLGAELNYGTQKNTMLRDSLGRATMFSGLLALKVKLSSKFACYTRGEYFHDPDEILTGPLENTHHQLVGINMAGITTGIEIKPIVNSYLRLEGRWLQTTRDEDIFSRNGHSSNQRWEVLAGLGLWF